MLSVSWLYKVQHEEGWWCWCEQEEEDDESWEDECIERLVEHCCWLLLVEVKLLLIGWGREFPNKLTGGRIPPNEGEDEELEDVDEEEEEEGEMNDEGHGARNGGNSIEKKYVDYRWS